MRPSRKQLSLALVLGAVIAGPAVAQPQPQASTYPPACETSKVSKGDVDRAHTVFLSGKQYLEESNYEKAISYFKDAYSIDCSIHAILPIIATAYERKGDRAEAVRALEEYQRRAPAAPDHEVIERRIRNLKDQLAREQPTSSAPTASAAPSAAPTSSVPPTTAPSASASAVPGPSPAPAPGGSEGHPIVMPWVFIGVGGAAIVAGAVLYGIGAGDISTAESHCPDHVCQPGDTADINKGNDGKSKETVGAILIGVGAAGVAAGVINYFVVSSKRNSAALAPVVGPGYAGVAAAGSF